MLDKVQKSFNWVTRTAMLFCILSLMVLMCYGFIDVWGRFLFNHPIQGTFELSELLMVGVVFLSIASCQAENRHMRVDILLTAFNLGKRLRLVLDITAYICGIAVFGLISWYSFEPAWYSWKIREVTWGVIPFPVYPAKFIVMVGSVLLVIQFTLDLIGAIKSLFSPK